MRLDKDFVWEGEYGRREHLAPVFRELLKMQKRNLSMEEKLADTELNNIQKAEFLIEDCKDRGIEFSKEDTNKILDFAGDNEDIGRTVQLVSDMEQIQKQRDRYGYDFTFMTPIDTVEEALEAYDRGEAVYLLYPDNTEGLAESRSEIENFNGYFGIEKEQSRDVSREQNSELIPVSKEIALEMWDKDLDVYVDGVRAESREDIENAPETAKLYLSEFQYSAQLDFEKTEKGNVMRNENTNQNPNIIGNTPYKELGGKGQLEFYKNLNNRHAANIAKQLDMDGVRFSGVKKGDTTTITVNKADIPKFEAAVNKVKAMYAERNGQNRAEEPTTSKPAVKPKTENPNVIGNTPYNELGEKNQLEYITNLKTRHALNIAKQLDEDGVKFSGLKKGTVTTITINKADRAKYEAAVEKVKASYSKINTQNAEPLMNAAPVPKPVSKQPPNIAADIDKAISDNNYELYRYDLKKSVTSVLEEHGAEKVSRTLAEYVVRHDYDGRIAPKNKEWAKSFDIPENRYPPVFQTHPTVLDGFISEARSQIKELELAQAELSKPKLPDIYNDKFLLSTERVELRDDYRGIPETKYYNSSVNEYFVENVGWLDNAAYDREQKYSHLNAKDFYEKVTMLNAVYVDTEGRTGNIDISKSDYELMTEKTYAPENKVAFEMAKARLNDYRNEAGISEKQTEYYAVRQTSERRFAVCSISADGLVTAVKPNITSIAEAKKAMLDIFRNKQGVVKCEFVHPQTLDEKSSEIYRGQSKELPEIAYRIQLNTDKNAAPDNTHFVQQYIKNADNTYAIGKVVAMGDYEKCNSVLNEKLHGITLEPPKQIFEIYQIKGGEETRDYRFEPFERLTAVGKKPEFANYEKVYEANEAMLTGKSVIEKLESAFYIFNQERPDDFKGHSLSVSDVAVMNDTAYYVDSVGFRQLSEFMPLEMQQSRFLDTLPQTLQSVADNPAELEAVSNKALKLNIPPEIIREACDMVKGGESLDNMANAYEEKFANKNAPVEETPEIEKSKPQKKPKL